jgi:hypothetical protein
VYVLIADVFGILNIHLVLFGCIRWHLTGPVRHGETYPFPAGYPLDAGDDPVQDGDATRALFMFAHGQATCRLSPDGSKLYFTEWARSRIRSIDVASRMVTTEFVAHILGILSRAKCTRNHDRWQNFHDY